jgi:hypothetical protein
VSTIALTTPILYTISAFDATQAQTLKFNVVGGSQSIANKLTIKNNVTLAEVYSQTQTTYRFEHTIPAGTLTNGIYYQAYVETYDAQGNVSSPSNTIQFYCYNAPSFAFSNMPTGNVIPNGNFSFDVTYNQIQGETLNTYTFNLYNSFGTLEATSGTLYNTSTSLPLTVSYLFSGFENSTEYYIECTGTTKNGMEVTTGKEQILVSFTPPEMYSTLFLTNNCKEGYITIQSNVIDITADTVPETPIYIDDKEIDLTAEGSYAEWKQGYSVSNNFLVRIWGRDFKENSEILRFTNIDGAIIILTYNTDSESGKVYIALRVVYPNDLWGYVIQSDGISTPETTEYVGIALKRINNLYYLECTNLGTVV